MKIASALLKPNMAEIESGLLELLTTLAGETSPEAQDLNSYIEKQIRHFHKVKTNLFTLENQTETPLTSDLFEDFRKMKLRLHFAERRRRLILSNQVRNRKMQERNEHVASAAA